MMRLSNLILLALATLIPASEGLAFVASFMRAPTVGPVAALKHWGRRSPTTTTPIHQSPVVLGVVGDNPNQEMGAAAEKMPIYEFGNEDDSSVRDMRSQMVDLVYQRSLDRLSGFDKQ
ncbi:expressed unknown protein [Seminavis robusta]|uniref:Uncharacterized protein n=1 Tax=Seminavis robusta TaxID=568900 RepID=A0A9N8ENC7_9STRA|nr:expressed unknown protein [Seminavis robusta]|eukprot:Sro1383_g268010.1 n/a (118) ;mRNA; f:18821-19174